MSADAIRSEDPVRGGRFLGVRARLLLAFFGISAFSLLAALAAIYAFGQVGERLDLIDVRVPQAVSALEISRAVDRLIGSAPALLAAASLQELDEVSSRMRPEVNRLIVGLNEVGRVETASEAAIAIQLLVASLRSNLAELEQVVGARVRTRERLAGLLQAVFRANQETQQLFSPWFQVMEVQVGRLLDDVRNRDGDQAEPSRRDFVTSIAHDRRAQATMRSFSTVIDQLARTATTADERRRLPVVEFQLRRGLDDLEARAKTLDPKLSAPFLEQTRRLRVLALGPDAIPGVRAQELDLVDKAEKLISDNTSLSTRLTAAVDRLVAEAETEVNALARGALSIQRVSTQILILFALLSLIGSILIVWLYVSRNLTRRLISLNDSVLAIAYGKHDALVDVPGNDEVGDMGRAVEILRKNTLERDELLAERAQAADRLEAQVRERTAALAKSVEELRALGEVSQAVNSTLDLQGVLATVVAKAAQLSATEGGVIYVLDLQKQEFELRATYGMDEELIAALRNMHVELSEAVGVAIESHECTQIADLGQLPSTAVNDAILKAGYRARLIVPMIQAGQVIGALVVRRKQPGEFPRSIIDLLRTFADQSVVAIQNARLFESVELRTRELGQSLADLRSAQDRLVQTQKLASLGQLTAGIAHEIKNPLNFVNNFSALSSELLLELQEILRDTTVNEKTRAEIEELMETLRGNLDKIEQHGKRADSIVKNMLLHSREGSGERRPVDINALVEESLNLAFHGARAEKQGFNIALERSFDSHAGEAELFPQEITRVLLNLISNGFYATARRQELTADPGFAPRLRAATRSLGDRVEIAIRDNGTGMPPEVKEKMFNPFFTTKPAGEGTGLGLSISHDIIVKQHAGTIEVDTCPGEFTEIRFMLPRRAANLARVG